MKLLLERSRKTDAGHREGRVARSIEQRTKRLPSDAFLWGAVGSMALSLGFMARRMSGAAAFVGQWAPTLLILGLYNKLVKLEGSDPRPGRVPGRRYHRSSRFVRD